MDRKALLILGMHRAGTSALARVLSLRGAHLPRHVLPANTGNADGYWEPEAVVALNTQVLDHFDLTWDDPFAAAHLPSPGGIPAAFRARARQVVLDEYGDAGLFVMKDPRCTLLQDFWVDVLQSLDIAVCPVVIMRPWQDVVASLVRRDGTSPESAALLYIEHGLAAAQALRFKSSVATYAQLIADWRGCTDRIAAEQGFQWPGADTHAGEIDAFLHPSHASSAIEGFPPALAAQADAVWSWFQSAADGARAPSSALAAIQAEWSEAASRLGPLLRDRARRQRATESEREQALAERNSALQIYADTDARLHAAQAEYERLLQEADERLRQTQSDYVERDEECAQLRIALDAARHEAELVLRSRSWRLTKPLRFAMRAWHRLRGTDTALASSAWQSAAQQPGGAIAGAPGRALQRRHAALARFLVAEFGDATALEVVSRIERYRLPVPSQEARSSLRLECSDDEALAWARHVATLAAGRAGQAGAPDVSIVIPVFNQVQFTLACIEALMCHATRFSFEVLVGDDGSSDATALALGVPMARVRHVRHASNLGFVRNCNETAQHAIGRHVVFLNNDTLVLPGWLDELIGTLEADDRIGLAGSKLIYADGQLQECGAIVWRDGSAWNYGRLADPRRPEFCYMRDVDYVSGASIALPMALWRALGGFDELFVPAYAEDADLAFRIRARGLRTVVQPLSQVIHFEGVSSGTDLGSGAKAYQVQNLEKLRDRWAGVLSGHRDNGDQPELEKERRIGKRALFIDHCTPTPNEDAGSLVVSEVMRIFSDDGYKVTFVPEDNFAHVGPPTAALQRRGIEAIYHPAYSRMPGFLSARRDPFDVIFLHRFGVGHQHIDRLRKHHPRARIIFLNADMHHVREMREAELSGDAEAMAKARRTRALELQVVAKADVTLVHSEFERDLLREALPDARVVLFPLVHDPLDDVAPLDARDGVCFVGGFRHPPNADGIRWFVETAWPLVLARMPEAQLYIVGSHMPADVRALGDTPGVRPVGFVEDLDGFLARRRLTIAPLRYGAGAKGKVAGSLAQGVPAICTPVAAEGMQLTPDENVLIGATPEALAAHVVRLLADDAAWQRLSAAGLAYAREVTSVDSARQRLRTLLDTL